MTLSDDSQFNELAGLYENMASWPFRKDIEIPSVLGRIGNVRHLDVFDFGCGTGIYSRILKERGAHRVVGYDIAEGMLKYASRREEKEQIGIEYTDELVPTLNHQFDLVLAVYVLPYASTKDDLVQMCTNMGKLLRPGGRLITLPIHPLYDGRPEYYQPYGFRLVSDTPHAEGGAVRLDLCHDNYDASVTAWYWSAAALESALMTAGFTSIQWKNPLPAGIESIDDAPDALKPYLLKPHSVLIDCQLQLD